MSLEKDIFWTHIEWAVSRDCIWDMGRGV